MNRQLVPLVRPILIVALGCAGCIWTAKDKPQSRLDLVRRLQTGDSAPVAMDFNDGGQAYLLAGMYGPVHVWRTDDVDGGAGVVLPVSEHVSTACFVNNDAVFMASQPGSVIVWSWKDRRELFQHRFGRRAYRSAISPDGRFIAFDGVVLDRQVGAEAGQPRPLATQSALAFDKNGLRVVSAGFQEPWIVVRDLPGGAAREWLAPDKVRGATLSARGDMVAAVMQDGDIHLWRQPGGGEAGSWSGYNSGRDLRFVRGDRGLVVADENGIAVYDILTSRRTYRGKVEGKLWVFAVEGDILAAGTTMGAVLVWNLVQEVLVARAQVSASVIAAIAISPDSRLLAAADQKGEVSLWRWK
jgi:hypothetical protein